MFLYVDEGAPVCSDSAVIEATALKAVLEDESIGLNLITNARFFGGRDDIPPQVKDDDTLFTLPDG